MVIKIGENLNLTEKVLKYYTLSQTASYYFKLYDQTGEKTYLETAKRFLEQAKSMKEYLK